MVDVFVEGVGSESTSMADGGAEVGVGGMVVVDGMLVARRDEVVDCPCAFGWVVKMCCSGETCGLEWGIDGDGLLVGAYE